MYKSVRKIQAKYDGCVDKTKEVVKWEVETRKKDAEEQLRMLTNMLQETSSRLETLKREVRQLVQAGAAKERLVELEGYIKCINEVSAHVMELI